MNLAETALVLATAAIYDRRTIGESDVRAWQKALHRVDYQTGIDAVVWFHQQSADPSKPAPYLDTRHIMFFADKRARPVSRHALESGPAAFDRSGSQQDHVAKWAATLRAAIPRTPDEPDAEPLAAGEAQRRLDQIRAVLDGCTDRDELEDEAS